MLEYLENPVLLWYNLIMSSENVSGADNQQETRNGILNDYTLVILNKDGDIVWTIQRCVDLGRNDLEL